MPIAEFTLFAPLIFAMVKCDLMPTKGFLGKLSHLLKAIDSAGWRHIFTREAPMGETAIVPNGHIVCLGQRLMLIRQFPELFSNKFLVYVIQSPGFQRRLQVAAIGMTVKHINVVDVENLVVPGSTQGRARPNCCRC